MESQALAMVMGEGVGKTRVGAGWAKWVEMVDFEAVVAGTEVTADMLVGRSHYSQCQAGSHWSLAPTHPGHRLGTPRRRWLTQTASLRLECQMDMYQSNK